MNLEPVNQPNILSPVSVTFQDDFYPGVTGSWAVNETRCNRTYTVRLKAFTDSVLCGPLQVIGSCPVQIGSSYQFPLMSAEPTEQDTGSFAQSIIPVRDTEGGGKQWTVTIEYAAVRRGQSARQQ